MNPLNITVNRETTFTVHNRHMRTPTVWQHGQTISAVLEGIDNGTASLRAEGDVLFYADASAIKGNVGDQLTFTVRRTRQGYELTQLTERNPSAAPPHRGRATSMDAIKEFTQTIDSIKENNELRSEFQQEQNLKVARAIAAIRRSQGFMAAAGGKSAAAAIVESGLDLSKVSFAALDRIMHHVERRPTQITPEDEKFLARNNGNTMVKSLHRHGLPVSERNISHMERAWDRLPDKMPDPVITHLITDENELTLDNIYKKNYTASEEVTNNPPPNPTQWNIHQAAVERLLEQEEIPRTRETLHAARFLFIRDLPITKVNIERILFLQALPDSVKTEDFPEAFFDRAAAFIVQDRPLGTLSLPEIVRLAETQLKMAVQAAARHQSLGIDTDAMRDNLRQLTQREAETYLKMASVKMGNPSSIIISNLFEANEANPSKNSAPQLISVFSALANLHPLTANVHANILHGQTPFTIDGVHESVLAARANEGYEQNATVPLARYGDSFAQVKTQFAPLLEDMGITPTSESVKAAFILSKNKMDVTIENLHAVKEIDAKITAITNKLHPLIAAKMITEGLNPLNMHADQLLAYIRQFNHDMGESGTEKIARYIRDMDESQSIDGDTRKSMIAVYRMLHVIQKDGAAALGLAAQLNTPITLGGLFDLAQNRSNRKRVDITVDDALGELERIVRPEGNIRAAIESGVSRHTLTHTDIIADTFTDIAAPTALEKLIQAANGMEQALEDLAAAEKPPTPSNPAAVLEQIQAFVSANPETIHKLQSRNISARPGYIKAADELAIGGSGESVTLTDRTGSAESSVFALENLLDGILTNEDINDDLLDAIPASDLQPLQAGQSPGQILAQIRAALGEEHIDPIQSLIAVTHGLNGDAREGFSLPVRINGRISHLQMYVLNDRALTEDGARVFLSIDTARLGTVSAYFTVSENGLDATVSAQSPAALEALESQKDILITLAQQSGIDINSVKFIHE
ncbi:MAG: flagellar hook-length control protein FliK [Defluviitaleaceae bacterium]|nr:flagellar hook-length control protein FliK [Defluviitaleaceae bacterium]